MWTRILIVAALTGAGLGATALDLTGLSSALLRPGRPSVADVHGAKGHAKLDCAKCHPAARGSRWASDRLVPSMETCGICHEGARGVTVSTAPSELCRDCHLPWAEGGGPVRGDYPRPDLRFSHAAHRAEACASCHPIAGARESRDAGRDVVGMRACYSCHRDGGRRLAECRTCHLVQKDGRLVKAVPERPMLPPVWLKGPTHGADWVQTHAPVAGADSAFCAACHRETECLDCHAGRLRPRDVHPGDWIGIHGLSGRMDNPRCAGCHRSQSFCIGCHRRTGVAPDSPSGARPPGSGAYHRESSPEEICRRARQDITSCVSCHSESSCVTCHATINPHPPGFSRRCKPLARKNHGACLKCHGDDGIWRRCR